VRIAITTYAQRSELSVDGCTVTVTPSMAMPGRYIVRSSVGFGMAKIVPTHVEAFIAAVNHLRRRDWKRAL